MPSRPFPVQGSLEMTLLTAAWGRKRRRRRRGVEREQNKEEKEKRRKRRRRKRRRRRRRRKRREKRGEREKEEKERKRREKEEELMAAQYAIYIGWGVYVGEGEESYHSRGCGLSSMNWHASCIPTFCRRSRVSLRD